MRLSEFWRGHGRARRHVALAALATGAMAMAMLGGAQAASASTANSSSPSVTVCHGGPIGAAGQTTTYRRLVVDGFCEVPAGATVVVDGSVAIAGGGTLLAFAPQTMTVRGNVDVGVRGILALGTAAGPAAHDTVYGSIRAIGAKAMYLFGDTVHGSVSFLGGGWGRTCTDPDADTSSLPGHAPDPLGHDLMVKDTAIHGSLALVGWSGCWLGALRNTVGGTMAVIGNYANPANVNDPVPPATSPTKQGLDSTEIGQNVVHGDLVCLWNTPRAQFGDSGARANVVSGRAIGECTALSVHP